ncbi:MAG TPA: serine/threonine-protein kinase [Actinomycetales bacterium]|nr:serine/threonine-protein kinase [Actinomycetales bacterium]
MPTQPTADPARPPGVPGYVTGRLLGFGASGEVWAATTETTGASVALKVLRCADGGADAEAAVRESALLRRVDHPHVLRLIDVVEVGRQTVLVLERAGGGSLAALVGTRGPLDPGEVVTMLTPIASALADLHGRGLVHGDVSPGNVLFADDGRPLLGDLGVAALLGLPGDVHATPGYGDPASAVGVPSPAGDVYSLAALGWFALTGQPPPPVERRAPLATLVPGTPHALSALVEASLDRVPGRRPSAAAFAVASFDAVPAVPVRLVPTDPTAAAAEVVTHRLRAAVTPAPAPRERPRRRWWRHPLLAVGAVALVLAGGATAALVATGDAGSSPPPVAEAAPPDAVADPASAVAPLSELRARAYATGDSAPLTAANAEGSPALAADLSLLADLGARDLVLEGLSFDVSQVEVIDAGDGQARVRVTVVTGAHRQVRTSDGSVVADVPASDPVTSVLRLAVVDGAWRVAEVLPPTP